MRVRRAPFLLMVAVLPVLILLLTSCSSSASSSWQSLDVPSSANVISLAADPSVKQLVYAGASDGVVYRTRSDEQGAAVSAGEGINAGATIAALLPNPRVPGTVYAGTRAGFYVTSDYGGHWAARGKGFPSSDTMVSLAIDPQHSTLFAGSVQHGVYTSHDGGATWQAANVGLPANANIFALRYDSVSNLIISAIDGAGLYVSIDGGQTWAQRSQGIPGGATVYALTDLPTHGLSTTGPTLYAGTSRGVYASTDSGQSWRAANQGLPAGRVGALTTNAAIPGSIYAGVGSAVYQSTNGGARWQVIAQGISQPISSLAAVPNAATHGEVYAAAGQLLRYPPPFSSNNANGTIATIITWIIGIFLVAMLYYTMRRARRLILPPPSSSTSSPQERSTKAGAATSVQGAEPEGTSRRKFTSARGARLAETMRQSQPLETLHVDEAERDQANGHHKLNGANGHKDKTK